MEITYRLPTKKLPPHLSTDLVHMWRAESGIELVHNEPTMEELNRIWQNWQHMPDIAKWLSDNMSLHWFGCTNEEHYQQLTESVEDLEI